MAGIPSMVGELLRDIQGAATGIEKLKRNQTCAFIHADKDKAFENFLVMIVKGDEEEPEEESK